MLGDERVWDLFLDVVGDLWGCCWGLFVEWLVMFWEFVGDLLGICWGYKRTEQPDKQTNKPTNKQTHKQTNKHTTILTHLNPKL